MTDHLQAFATTDLNDYCQDCQHHDYSILKLALRSYGHKQCFAGRARTLVTCEDSALAKQLYQQPGNGAIAIIDGGGSMHSALLGDLNATLLVDNGWSGIIINGAVRDTQALSGLNLGIQAIGSTPVRSAKAGIGAIDVAVAFGCCLIEPGDCIYADQDGVLISKRPLIL